MKPVRFLSPTFPSAEDIAADYAEILGRGWFSNMGPFEQQLTGDIEKWVGSGVHASVVTSCTTGLAMAIGATFQQGKKFAIVASFTFAAGPLTIRNTGFEPVFVDVDPVSWQPLASDAERLLKQHRDQVAGILLTTTFGVADAAIEQWEWLATKYGLPLVIDTAAGFGAARESGERLGARGTCEVFSLHATKMMAIGEGGVITSRNAEFIRQMEQLKNFGFDAQHRCASLGTNAKLPELSAAIGVRQMKALPQRLELRQQVVRDYLHALTPLGVKFQPGIELSAPAFVSALLPSGAARDIALSTLRDNGVECRDYYNPPMHRQPYFATAPRASDLTVTDDLSARMLSLPMADALSPEVPGRVANVIETILSPAPDGPAQRLEHLVPHSAA